MKLYKFTLSTWRGVTVSKTVLEVEEKPKTYITVNERWKTRISKSEIGVPGGWDEETLYLLEDDIEKAKAIFVESLKGKIELEQEKIENTIKSCNERIEKYKKCIAELLKGEEG